MADEPKKEVEQVLSQAAPAKGAGTKRIVLIALAAAVVIASAATATVVSKAVNVPQKAQASEAGKKDGKASEEKESKESKEPKEGKENKESAGHDSEFEYVDFEPIVVNLNGPRLERYIRATVVLALRKADAKDAQKALESRKRELKSWLTVYFSGCAVEDVRGPRNLNRIRREIEEAFNEQLWPDAKPLISHVLFKDFAVQ